MIKNIKIPFVDLYPQYEECQTEIDSGIADLISKSDFLTGKTVDKFEKAICDYTGAEDCASVGSGTDALYCALRALGVGEGDEVLTVGHTYISTTEAIVNVGATPRFVDIDKFYLIDLENIKVNDNTKAIVFVDLYGQTADIDKIKNFANERGLCLIEDAAQSFGSEYKGQKVGSITDLTCMSFNPVKNLGAMGDAGAVTGSKALVDKVRMYRDHGRDRQSQHTVVGVNARIDNIQAVVIQAKLKKLDKWIDTKRKICANYTQKLNDVVKCPQEAPWSKHTYYVYVIETPEGTRNDLSRALYDKGIETNIHYRHPTYLTKPYQKYATELHRTEYVCHNILSLPCYHSLPEHHQNYVIKAIRDFYKA